MSLLWEELKRHIKGQLPDKSYSLWINPLSLIDEKEDSLVLGCPNKFSMNWIIDHYGSLFEKCLRELGKDHNITYKVATHVRKKKEPDIFENPPQLNIPNISTRKTRGQFNFNREFTFDRFVVGDCNEFAYSASRAMASGGSCSYDTLFMMANTGLGKSHLSQSIGHMLLENNPDVRAYYITAEDFVNEMIFALKTNRIDEFKNKYRRSCDVLMLEEVHFLSGKEKIQTELGYTLDALANDNKKLIFTSSLLPKDIPNMSRELSSRLTSGIITTLEKPDYNTRLMIIEKKASENNLMLSEEIVHFFAEKLTKDIRQIESALRCFKAKAELMKVKTDINLAKEVLKYYLTEQGTISLDTIKKIICKYYKIEQSILPSKSRKKIHAFPRNMYVYLSRNYSEATLEEIGKSINRNHSTIIYSSEVIEKKIKIDKKVKNQVDFLSQKIKDIGC
ncbi:MAG: chromosomal replication initiator protein DnaA [Deltaproteobacteria bacterium]|nr:chromosomal replication initiator protein DnaA [Deltaproteobacteria bacterium]